MQRGHSREPVIFENSDYLAYPGWLKEAAERYDCDIHAYALMTNHIHRRIAQGRDDVVVKERPLYTCLGKTVTSRCEAYKALFRAHLDEGQLQDIRAAWQTGTLLGDEYFREKIEQKLKIKVGQVRRGWPDGPLKGLCPL